MSKKVFYELLRVAEENDFYRLPEGTRNNKYFECFNHINNEIWINCGSCLGDTILNYITQGYNFKKIFAIEGDKNNFKILQNNMKKLPLSIYNKLVLLNMYISDKQDKLEIEKIFKYIPVSFINMDIEGFEMNMLNLLENIIQRKHPVLAICAYHKTNDLYDIPYYISSICNQYKFYLRKYNGFENNAFNEFVYYCVPFEREMK